MIDGEEVLQDALIKAVVSLASAGGIGSPEGWLFRIAHNTALDFLRRRNRSRPLIGRRGGHDCRPARYHHQPPDRNASLRAFMRLPVAQRSSVILTDVLGRSLREVCEVMDCSLPAVKAALHRGRARLRELAEPDDRLGPELSETDRARLGSMSRISMAGFRRHPRHDRGRGAARTRQQEPVERQGRGVAIFRKLSEVTDWHSVPGMIEDRPGILVFDPGEPGSGPNIHAAAVVGRQGRNHQRFPPRIVRHRRRRVSDLADGP